MTDLFGNDGPPAGSRLYQHDQQMSKRDLKEGRRRRDDTLDHLTRIRGAILDVLDIEVSAIARKRANGCVDADDAYDCYTYWREHYERAGTPLPDFDKRFLGGLWSRGHWKKVGETQTSIPSRHARPIACWRLE